MTVGVPLDFYKSELKPVSFRHNKHPWNSFDGAAIVGPKVMQAIQNRYEGETFNKMAKCLPFAVFERYFTFDQMAKIRFSSLVMIKPLDDYFENDPEGILVYKIQNSIWRWGTRHSSWNNVVEAHRSMLTFDLGLPDFTVTLDHTTYHNERGRGQHSSTYLDGVFAYLIHYRGEHVMTVGFSISSGRRVFIQQIQMVKRRGNRFLYHFPKNRVEFIIERMKMAFPGHHLYLADADSVLNISLSSYRESVSIYEKMIESFRRCNDTEALARYSDHLTGCQEKIKHLTQDFPRLRAFYSDTGRYKIGNRKYRTNQVTHLLIAV